MRRPIHILLIDDDQAYCETVAEDAERFNLKISMAHNFEDGFQLLEEKRKFKAVILDDRCILSASQAQGTGKRNFVIKALDKLNQLEHQFQRMVPFCINAENPQEFAEDFEGITEVFQKSNDHSLMMKFLIDKIFLLPEIQAKARHEDVFEFVEDFLNEEDEDLLCDILIHNEKHDTASIVSNLSNLRRLEEKLCDCLAINILEMKPFQFEEMHQSRTKTILKMLYDKRILPQFLYDFSMDLYTIASRYGNHNPPMRTKNAYFPTAYTVQVLSAIFLDLITWAKQKIK